MSDFLTQYLGRFAAAAEAAGLPVRAPGKNWIMLAPLVRSSHISLSVTAHQIQVNLNNDDDPELMKTDGDDGGDKSEKNESDGERKKFDALARERQAIEKEIGEGLIWDKKRGRKKTVIRATYDAGYADTEWDAQHHWAIGMMTAFTSTLGPRLR
jgi:hypothetical protein